MSTDNQRKVPRHIWLDPWDRIHFVKPQLLSATHYKEVLPGDSDRVQELEKEVSKLKSMIQNGVSFEDLAPVDEGFAPGYSRSFTSKSNESEEKEG